MRERREATSFSVAIAMQIEPPFHSYGAHRGMSRSQFDLKDPGDLAAFLDLATRADVLIESFRPGVVAKLGIAGVKAACDAVGLVGGKVRMPLTDGDEAMRAKVKTLLSTAGVGAMEKAA